jgi:hypothetical protein
MDVWNAKSMARRRCSSAGSTSPPAAYSNLSDGALHSAHKAYKAYTNRLRVRGVRQREEDRERRETEKQKERNTTQQGSMCFPMEQKTARMLDFNWGENKMLPRWSSPKCWFAMAMSNSSTRRRCRRLAIDASINTRTRNKKTHNLWNISENTQTNIAAVG